MFKIGIKHILLLTGAGFTKSFGGFLANKMWEGIFNNTLVQGSQALRSRLIEDSDFESVYSAVIDDPTSSEDDRQHLQGAISKAYQLMDESIRSLKLNGSKGAPDLKFLKPFGGNSSERGLIFTLNQDLWLERTNQCNCPGVPQFTSDLLDSPYKRLTPQDFVSLPESGIKELAHRHVEARNGFIYIKLHGSYGWKPSEHPQLLVIGRRKNELIAADKLLTWYSELFKWAIRRGNQKLLIIGYGFRDEHINQIILEGVEKHNLGIYIIDILPFNQLRDQMASGHSYAIPILKKGLKGYYSSTLVDIFPRNEVPTTEAQKLLRVFDGP